MRFYEIAESCSKVFAQNIVVMLTESEFSQLCINMQITQLQYC